MDKKESIRVCVLELVVVGVSVISSLDNGHRADTMETVLWDVDARK